MGEEQQILEEMDEESPEEDETEEEIASRLQAEEWAKKAEEVAKKKAEEEAKLKAEEKAKKEAKEKTKEGKTEKIPWGMSDPVTLHKVLEALEYKGGTATVPKLKVSTLLDDQIIAEALRTGLILDLLIINKDESYSLNDNSRSYLGESKEGRKNILAQLFLKIEDYKDIIYQAKMKGGNIRKKEIAKSFYILDSSVREELRHKVVDCFVNLAISSNMLEFNGDQANPGYNLIKNGEIQLQNYMDNLRNKKKGKKTAPTAAIQTGDLSCGSCGKSISPDFAMCPYCGTPQKAACAKCGKDLQAGWKMCPFCGSPR
ncbi:MAG: zinc ribbon domain-containing protein [archaeon]|nr:zinc ribbon domain-containing protein [archaeon]